MTVVHADDGESRDAETADGRDAETADATTRASGHRSRPPEFAFEDVDVGVVVPAYDEEHFVGDVVDSIPRFVDRIYAVDDASSDRTWAEISSRAAEVRPPDQLREEAVDSQPETADDESTDGRVVGIRHETNRGRGGAIKSGYRHALADGVDVIAVLDGDGQMDPAILDRILAPVVAGEADYAKGTRLTTPADWDAMTKWRLFGNVLLTGVTRISSGYWRMTDPQNGYTAISADALQAVDFEGLYPEYGFLNDLLAKLNVAGLRVANVPMQAVYGDEESGICYRSFVPNVSVLLLRNFLWRLRETHLGGGGHPAPVVLYSLGVSAFGSGVGGLLVLLSPVESMFDASTVSAALLMGILAVAGAMAIDRHRNASLEFTTRVLPGEETG